MVLDESNNDCSCSMRQVAERTALIQVVGDASRVAKKEQTIVVREREPTGMLAPGVQATTIELSLARVAEGVNGR
jgi:hypothetical protein